MRRSRVAAVVLLGSVFVVAACSSSDAPDLDPDTDAGQSSGGSSGASSSGASGGASSGQSTSSSSGGEVDSGPPAPTHDDGIKNGDETDVDCGGATAPACAPGLQCLASTDCTDKVCSDGVCAAATHDDGVKNGDETDVDCGGATAPGCVPGLVCVASTDCAEKVCTGGVCAAPTYDDGVQNGDETGIDCGGGAPSRCAPGQGCASRADCVEDVCIDLVCAAATATDGVRNGDETDVDCGGSSGRTCEVGLLCLVGADCTQKVCGGNGTCSAPTFTDGVQNGNETGLDCGGPDASAAQRCATGQGCVDGQGARDCVSLVCSNAICQAPSFNDGVKNGTETDVDCGGPDANAAQRCATGRACVQGPRDCSDQICTGGACVAPSFTDGVKNGTETDVDCGGAAATPLQRCVLGKTCAQGTRDCRSGGCLNNVCVPHSCEAGGGNGIDTCGLGGAGGQGAAQWESCCATANVTVPQQGNAQIPLGKYEVTAGRMRKFLEDVNYDVRGFVRQARADGLMPKIPAVTGRSNSSDRFVLEEAWDMYLPKAFALDGASPAELTDYPQNGNANNAYRGIYSGIRNHLGGTIFRDNAQSSTGCFVGNGTHAFRFPNNAQDGNTAPGYDQALYDTKSMQCVTYLVAQAFCVWDGGRLETTAEWFAAWGPGALPWSAVTANTPRKIGSSTWSGCRFPSVNDATLPASCPNSGLANQTIEFASYWQSYQWPASLINDDYIVFLTAPGRTRGRGPNGHADIVGSHFGITSDVTYNASPFAARHRWTASGTWEVHDYSKNINGWGDTMLLNKYGKLGMRCSYPNLP